MSVLPQLFIHKITQNVCEMDGIQEIRDAIQEGVDENVRVLRDFVLSVFTKASFCWLKLLFISKAADFADRILASFNGSVHPLDILYSWFPLDEDFYFVELDH